MSWEQVAQLSLVLQGRRSLVIILMVLVLISKAPAGTVFHFDLLCGPVD